MNLQPKKINFIILAGGSGKRLWPLSRYNNPKQFLCVEKNRTLLESTVSRLKNGFEDSNIYVVCNKDHESKVESLVSSDIKKILPEPKSCNTASAMLYSIMCLNLKSDEIVVFVPADHHILDEAKFREAVAKAVELAQKDDSLVLIGIKPNYPATNFGYISYKENSVEKFHEKPNLEVAESYLLQNNILWNSGILIGKAESFIECYKKISPEFFYKMEMFLQNKSEYDFQNISTDYLILEKLKNLKVIKAEFDWSDLGTLDLFLAARKDGLSNIIQIDAKNNLTDVNNKLVVLVGVENLCIVDVGDVLLVANNDNIQKLNEVVDHLQKSNLNNFC